MYIDGVGYSKISIHCYQPQRTDVLLHELSHIAVFRLESFVTKAYRVGVGFCAEHSIDPDLPEGVSVAGLYAICNGTSIEPGDGHGEIFQRFLNIIENRAIMKGWTFFEIKGTKVWTKNK
jgi:hypothetical protein